MKILLLGKNGQVGCRPQRRNGAKEFFHFIGISRGSLAELETQMQLAMMLGFTTMDHVAFDLAERTGKLFTGLHKKWSIA